jgi:3-hydroxybutyryl-CoA dehydrogenase
MAIQTVGVIGAGGNGPAIVQACVLAGFSVTLVDQDKALLQHCTAAVGAALQSRAQAGQLAEPALAAALKRIACSTQVADFHGDDLVIVANEDALVQAPQLLQTTEAALGTYALIAIPAQASAIDAQAARLARPGLLIGMRFAASGVALLRGSQTSDQSVALGQAFIDTLKTHGA